MNPKIFFGELKRRNVYKVGVAYAIVAWLLMQIASQIFPFFEIPNWVVRLVVILLIVGFPVALIIAWAFEVTPEGIKRTEAADAAGQRSRGVAWIYVVLIGVALSVGLFFVGRFTAGHATPRSASEELRRGKQSEVATAGPDKSIAVLPLYQIAEVYAVRGEKDKAFEWLQISFDNHDTGTLTLLVDPLLRDLHDDARYKNFLAKLGLPTTS
jgi:hypothetical protein